MNRLSSVFLSKIGIIYSLSSLSISLLIYFNYIVFAGFFLTFVIVSLMVYSFFKKHNGEYFFTSVILIFSPFLGFLRQYILSYNGLSYILIILLILWFVKSPKQFSNLVTQPKQLGIYVFIALFIIYGLLLGAHLSRFMKFIETALAFTAFSLFLKKPQYFTRINIYFIISSILLVLSLSGNAQTRFVFEDTNSISIKADPSMLSIGLVLSGLLLIIDNAYWVSFFRNGSNKLIKYSLIIIILVLLVITTSRIGFLTFSGALFVWVVLRGFNFRSFIPLSLVVILSFGIIMNSQYADLAELWFNKTFNNENGIAGATTGRADQWEMAFEYIQNDSFDKILFGYGPGNAPMFSEKYSTKINAIDSMYGKAFELHSLYLNVLIEYGLIPFILFIGFLLSRFKILYLKSKFRGVDLPLIILFSYLIYIFSVSGLGVIPALLISIFVNDYNIIGNKRKLYVSK